MVRMMNYNLSDLIGKAKDIKLPRMVERLTSQRTYQKILRRMLKETGSEINKTLLAVYAESLNEDSTIETAIITYAVFTALAQATEGAKTAVSQLIAQESVYLDKAFVQGVKSATKADISALIGVTDTDDLINNIVKRNVSLITDLSEQTRTRIEQAVINGQINGTTKTQLKKELNEILGKQAKRGDLIASDQMEKLSSELTAFRAKQGGLYKYVWRTQGDSRVRSKHQYLAGKTQDTRKANSGDNGQLPRQPIRCRCWAQWLIDDEE
ncbi:hypothetical protein CIK80_02175 [Psychrobacter sp. JB193]|nr:hypothetical protein CIK80_02175 [Psychrobacter sp. JB193]